MNTTKHNKIKSVFSGFLCSLGVLSVGAAGLAVGFAIWHHKHSPIPNVDDNIYLFATSSNAIVTNDASISTTITVTYYGEGSFQLKVPTANGVAFDSNWNYVDNTATIQCHWQSSVCPTREIFININTKNNILQTGVIVDVIPTANTPYVLATLDKPVGFDEGLTSSMITFKGYNGFILDNTVNASDDSDYLISNGMGRVNGSQEPNMSNPYNVNYYKFGATIRENNRWDIPITWNGADDDIYLGYEYAKKTESGDVIWSANAHLFIPISTHNMFGNEVLVDDPSKFDLKKMDDFSTIYSYGLDNSNGRLNPWDWQRTISNTNFRKFIFNKNQSPILPDIGDSFFNLDSVAIGNTSQYLGFILKGRNSYPGCAPLPDYPDKCYGFQGFYEEHNFLTCFNICPSEYSISNKIFLSSDRNATSLYIPLHRDYFHFEDGKTYAHRQYFFHKSLFTTYSIFSASTPFYDTFTMAYDTDTNKTHYGVQLMANNQSEVNASGTIQLNDPFETWKIKGISNLVFDITDIEGKSYLDADNTVFNANNNTITFSMKTNDNGDQEPIRPGIFFTSLSFDIQDLDSI